MLQYVAITDGTTTLELTDTINYALVSYAPGVPTRKRNELSGEGPYIDMPNTITFHAMGCTAADAYAAVAAVQALLDQAQRWGDGEEVDAVLVVLQAQDSATSPLEAVIKSAPLAGEPLVTLPATWIESYGKYVIENVTIQFVRRGLLHTGATASASSGSGANPTVLTATLTSATISSPMLLDLLFPTRAAGDLASGSYLLVANDTNEIQIYEAEALTSGPFTSVADAANSARGGSVLRYTPTDTLFNGSGGQDITSIWQYFQTFSIFAAVRNNSATTTWRIKVGFSNVSADILYTAEVAIDASSTSPRIVPLGIMANWVGGQPRASTISIWVAASAAAGSLDIDYIALLALNDECSRAIGFGTAPFSIFGAGGTVTLELDPKPLTLPQPFVNVSKVSVAGQWPVTYLGDPWLSHRGTAVAACFLATGGSVATKWRYYDGSAVVSNSFNVTRYDSAVVPT